jgi:hypothetical protein
MSTKLDAQSLATGLAGTRTGSTLLARRAIIEEFLFGLVARGAEMFQTTGLHARWPGGCGREGGRQQKERDGKGTHTGSVVCKKKVQAAGPSAGICLKR